MTARKTTTSRQEVARFEQLTANLGSLSEEFSNLAKKAPDAPLNKFKVSLLNERLDAANELLGDDQCPFKDFRRFDDASLPTASDVVVVLSQYLSTLEGWRSARVVYSAYNWYWDTPEQDYRADAPTIFKRKQRDDL